MTAWVLEASSVGGARPQNIVDVSHTLNSNNPSVHSMAACFDDLRPGPESMAWHVNARTHRGLVLYRRVMFHRGVDEVCLASGVAFCARRVPCHVSTRHCSAWLESSDASGL